MNKMINISILGIAGFLLLACSGTPVKRTLVEGKLESCPSSPNCVQSEFPTDQDHYFEALSLGNATMPELVKIIKAMNGTIVSQSDIHVHATFTSTLMRFVDDFELRIDSQSNALHLRSASRVGYSDMGVNRDRAEEFKKLFEQSTES